jgi:uncharacterized protein
MVSIDKMMANATEFLPNVRPLHEFLHLNILPGLQQYPFWDALKRAANHYAIHPFLPLSQYQKLFNDKVIDEKILKEELLRAKSPCSWEDLFADDIEFTSSEKSFRPLHITINKFIKYSLFELTSPLLFRFTGQFLDQGISFSELPYAHQSSLLGCFFQLSKHSSLPLYPFHHTSFPHFGAHTPPETIIHELLTFLIGKEDEALFQKYIQECLLGQKGWAGLITQIEKNPQLLARTRKVSLKDFLALHLLIEVAWLKELAPHFQGLIHLPSFETQKMELQQTILPERRWQSYIVWQKAFEKTYLANIVEKMQRPAPLAKAPTVPAIQAFFCIDDRECALRRHLEHNLGPKIQTFGTPGHFGLDYTYLENANSLGKKQCPAPVPSAFTITRHDHAPAKEEFFWRFNHSPKLLLEAFKGLAVLTKEAFIGPYHGEKVPLPLIHLEREPQITLKRNNKATAINLDNISEEEDLLFFSSRLAGVFKSIGLTTFSPLVVCVGHRATTTNNPYFTAYGCGACSGRSGEMNSYVFSALANHPLIRQTLKTHFSIHIPEKTIFVAGVHDTTEDRFYGVLHPLLMNDTHHPLNPLWKNFVASLKSALETNAWERCQMFSNLSSPQTMSKKQATGEVQHRAHALFEPRPELGHSFNALCLVMNREHIKHISFERRAFLQSYDYREDLDGQQLTSILGAAIPVCGGINLDYLFAKMVAPLGAGSKLSHNVMGLCALSHGTEEDLLSGLAYQMVEQHPPQRMTFIIEHYPEIVRELLAKPPLSQWVHNEWVLVIIIHPETKEAIFLSPTEQGSAHL